MAIIPGSWGDATTERARSEKVERRIGREDRVFNLNSRVTVKLDVRRIGIVSALADDRTVQTIPGAWKDG
jgi:hypothetical protein